MYKCTCSTCHVLTVSNVPFGALETERNRPCALRSLSLPFGTPLWPLLYTHARTHTHTQIHMYVCVHVYSRTHARARAHTHTHRPRHAAMGTAAACHVATPRTPRMPVGKSGRRVRDRVSWRRCCSGRVARENRQVSGGYHSGPTCFLFLCNPSCLARVVD